jgi:hypothetical protein
MEQFPVWLHFQVIAPGRSKSGQESSSSGGVQGSRVGQKEGTAEYTKYVERERNFESVDPETGGVEFLGLV